MWVYTVQRAAKTGRAPTGQPSTLPQSPSQSNSLDIPILEPSWDSQECSKKIEELELQEAEPQGQGKVLGRSCIPDCLDVQWQLLGRPRASGQEPQACK